MEDRRRIDESYNDKIARLYPEESSGKLEFGGKFCKNITFQTNENCNLCCTYCYEGHKTNRVMTFETAKKAIDILLSDSEFCKNYCNISDDPAIILDFIGGEPTLQLGLIDKICDYFFEQAYLKGLHIAHRFMISMSTNGTLCGTEEFRNFKKKWGNHFSYGVTVDGNKELHDSCRVFPDGTGSFDLAIAAAKEALSENPKSSTKFTLAPENIEYLVDALKYDIDMGYQIIHINCVYEEGWNIGHAKVLYNKFKEVADYILENDKEDVIVSIFDENIGQPMPEEDNQNWCWGKGTLILTSEGYRPIEELKIGDKVYTHTGELKPIVDTKKHLADNCVTAKATGMFESVMTDNHKLFVTEPITKNSKKFGTVNKKQVKDIFLQDRLGLFTLPQNRTEHLDEEIAYLVGRFVGDGYTTTQGGKNIVCSFKETDELKKHFDSLGLEYSIIENKTVNEFHIFKSSSNEKNIILNKLLADCGIRADGKHFPKVYLQSDDITLKSMLKGYLDADGNKKKKNVMACNTVGRQLAEELMLILRTIGFAPTCYINKRAGNSKILGRDVVIKDRYEIYFTTDNSSRFIKRDVAGFECSTKNFKILSDTEPQEVYNITVEDNHSYIANGIISANCGGVNGLMLAIDVEGNFYPCQRYMPISIGQDQIPYVIGDLEHGLCNTEEHKKRLEECNNITRRSQSTDECFNCPIASGCGWCSAYNYQKTGTVNKRVTYICPTHKARTLFNCYYWNKLYRKRGESKRYLLHIPDNWALEIIDEEELEMLKNLAKEG